MIAKLKTTTLATCIIAALFLTTVGSAQAAACKVYYNGLVSYPTAQSLILNGVNVVAASDISSMQSTLTGSNANITQYDAI